MIDTLFIATNNKNKLKEFKDILAINNLDIQILSPLDFDDKSEPNEDGFSYEENAYIKANYYFKKYHYPTLADDSGIDIDYFNKLPNIHSSRFLHIKDYKLKNELIIDLMNHISNRKAMFIDVLCFIDSKGNITYSRGENQGLIAYKQAGDKGFGYDPIFIIEEYNKTEAELGDEYKNNYSHRANAMKKWVKYVKENRESL